jgi:hypothetical protein
MDRADFEENGDHKKKEIWPIAVLGAGVVCIITFGFILGISPSTMNISNPSAVHAVADVPTTSKQPLMSTHSGTSATVPENVQQPAAPASQNPPSMPSSLPNNPSTQASTPSTPAPVSSSATNPSDTGAWNTTADSYLQNLNPKWGTPAAPDPNCPLCNGNSRPVQLQGQELLTK